MSSQVISTNPGRMFEEIGRVGCSNAAQIDSAVNAAKRAFPGWRQMTVEDRCVYVNRYRELLEKRAGDIAELQSKEIGKPITQSHEELTSAIRFLKNQTEKAATLLASRILDSYATHQTELHCEPYGVAAVITPWNFPTGQFIANSSQVLISGNAVILKHSEECVLTSQLLASLAREAQFPEGIFQVLYGDGEVGSDVTGEGCRFYPLHGEFRSGKKDLSEGC